jgi:protein-disulfide isomerase
MTKQWIKMAALPVVFGAGLYLGAMTNQSMAAENLTKADVEKIVQEYIMNNANVILDSVDQYQQKTVREKSIGAIRDNVESLTKDSTAPFIGNKDGDITIVEFFDYNCGYCKKVLPELQKVVAEDKNLKVIFKDYPILGPASETAAKWSLAAQRQGKYFEFHKIMMEHKGPIEDATLEKAAKDAGMDVTKAKEDAASADIMIQIEKNRTLGNQVGVRGTPAFVIEEELMPGAMPAEQLRQKIEELRKAKAEKK